jgi:hypothetical protein
MSTATAMVTFIVAAVVLILHLTKEVKNVTHIHILGFVLL